MSNIYVGVQNKQGIVDIPPYVNTVSDGASVDLELNINTTAMPDRVSVLLNLEKIHLFLASCPWPPANQAL